MMKYNTHALAHTRNDAEQIGEADLVTRLQWLAETLYHDRILQFYEVGMMFIFHRITSATSEYM